MIEVKPLREGKSAWFDSSIQGIHFGWIGWFPSRTMNLLLDLHGNDSRCEECDCNLCHIQIKNLVDQTKRVHLIPVLSCIALRLTCTALLLHKEKSKVGMIENNRPANGTDALCE